MKKQTQEKINELQLLEQNLQNVLMQKNSFNSQFLEIKNALKEIETAKNKIYKITGTIMIEAKKENLKKELTSKKEVIELRIKNIEKQEKQLQEKYSEIQKIIMKELKK